MRSGPVRVFLSSEEEDSMPANHLIDVCESEEENPLEKPAVGKKRD